MRNGLRLINAFNWDVHKGEGWWICGANGSGKTTLLEVLAGQQRLAEGEMVLPENGSADMFPTTITLIKRDFSLYHFFNRSATYYQQRYFSLGIEETPLVIDFITSETGIAKDNIHAAAHEFGIDPLLNKHIVSLSTGEGRRILLLLLWLTNRKIICFDDPYAGLDLKGKQLVSHALHALLKKNVTLLITGVETQPPDFISHVLHVKNQGIAFAGKLCNFTLPYTEPPIPETRMEVKKYVRDGDDYSFAIAAEMKHITIQYDNNIVLKDFSWKINRGDKWMLTGDNGSGKSTLMSLIYGDNPMAYAYELVIFDRIRGTGETIWDVKRPMGFFSSELQQCFPRSMTLYEAVLTGYSDHLVVRDNLKREHHRQAIEIIEAARIARIKDSPLFRLSYSQCRLVLVCRALVKHPPVVILDEPCQGLDQPTCETVNRLVDVVCCGAKNTLIYVTHQTNYVPNTINRHLHLEKQKQHQSLTPTSRR